MVMYEIWSLGKKPFPQLSPAEVQCMDAVRVQFPIWSCFCNALCDGGGGGGLICL